MFRKANSKDVDRISEIYDEIHSEIESGKIETGWVRDTYPTRKTVEDSIARGDMFVGEDNNQVVSAAIINKEQGSLYKGQPWSYDVPEDEVMVLHTLVVSPLIKGQGYGTKFVSFYEEYALDNGCKYLRMDTNEANMNARKLYEKLGYKEINIITCVFNDIPGVRLVFLEKTLS